MRIFANEWKRLNRGGGWTVTGSSSPSSFPHFLSEVVGGEIFKKTWSVRGGGWGGIQKIQLVVKNPFLKPKGGEERGNTKSLSGGMRPFCLHFLTLFPHCNWHCFFEMNGLLSTFKHCLCYTDMLVFLLKFRLWPVCEYQSKYCNITNN